MKIRVKAMITLERDYPPTTDVRTVFLDVCESLKLLSLECLRREYVGNVEQIQTPSESPIAE